MDDNRRMTQNLENIKRPLTFHKSIPYSTLNKNNKETKKNKPKTSESVCFPELSEFQNEGTTVPV